MSYYNKIKKLDLESEGKLTEGSGPADQCLCSLLAPPEDEKKGFGAMRDSIKKAFRFKSASGAKRTRHAPAPVGGVVVPLTFQKGGKGLFTTRETVKRKTPCGKCGCDKDDVVMKHSYANIKIITPDVSSICPCPTDCLPNKDKLNNISVTVERMELHPDLTDSEASVSAKPYSISEPTLERRSPSDLVEDQYADEEDNQFDVDQDDTSDWSFASEEKP